MFSGVTWIYLDVVRETQVDSGEPHVDKAMLTVYVLVISEYIALCYICMSGNLASYHLRFQLNLIMVNIFQSGFIQFNSH